MPYVEIDALVADIEAREPEPQQPKGKRGERYIVARLKDWGGSYDVYHEQCGMTGNSISGRMVEQGMGVSASTAQSALTAPEAFAAKWAAVGEIDVIVHSLSFRARQVLHLTYRRGMAQGDIAAIARCEQYAVSVRLKDALEECERMLKNKVIRVAI